MNREELSNYIDNCYMIGRVVDTRNALYREWCTDACYPEPDLLLGAVLIDGVYFKKDNNGKIHLVYCDVELGDTLDLGDCIDVFDEISLPSINYRHVVINTLKVIPMGAFAHTDIETFRGDNVEVVELRAFAGCDNLRELILPKAKLIYTRDTDFSNVNIIAPATCEFSSRQRMNYKKKGLLK